MKKTINVLEIRVMLARFLRQAKADVERTFTKLRSVPAAVAIPAELDDQPKRSRQSHLERFGRAQMRYTLSPYEADALAREALKAAKSRFES